MRKWTLFKTLQRMKIYMNAKIKIVYSPVSRHIRQKKMHEKYHTRVKNLGLEKVVFLNLPIDSNELLMIMCNEALKVDYPIISLANVIKEANVSTTAILKGSDAFLNLTKSGYIKLLTTDVLSGHSDGDIIHLTAISLDRYFHIFLNNYELIKKTVIEFILFSASNHYSDMLKSEIISKTLKQKKLVINTILERLEYEGKISILRSHGENWIVKEIKHDMFRKIINHL